MYFVRRTTPVEKIPKMGSNQAEAVKTILIDYLTRPNYVLRLFGFASPPKRCSIIFRIVYGLYSAAVITLITLVLLRSLTMIRYDSHMSNNDIGMILVASWGVQALFSSIFVIYHSRRPAVMEEMRTMWLQCGCDGLISYTNCIKIMYRMKYLFHAFSILNVVINTGHMLLGYFKIYQHDPWPDNLIFYREYKLYVLVPFGLYALVAWMLPLYRYYVSCFLFRYCWIGFCAKVQEMANHDMCFKEALKYVSRQHRQLCDLMAMINKIYGLYVLVILATSLPVIILECYLFAALPNDWSFDLQMGWWLFTSVVQVFIIFSASFITDGANGTAEAFYGFYEKLDKKQLEESEEGQTNLMEASILLQRLNTTNVAISAWGWFDVTKSGLLALGSVLLTYYIVLIQFTQSPTCNCSCGNGTVGAAPFLEVQNLSSTII